MSNRAIGFIVFPAAIATLVGAVYVSHKSFQPFFAFFSVSFGGAMMLLGILILIVSLFDKRRASTRAQSWIVMIAVVGVLISFGSKIIYHFAVALPSSVDLDKHLKEFSTILDDTESFTTPPSADMYRKGRIVILEGNSLGRYVSDENLTLPDVLRARAAIEVGTVAQKNCWKKAVGHYEGGEEADQWRCTIRLIDASSKSVAAEKTFDGGYPPFHKLSSDSSTGSPVDNAEINKWIMALPAR